MVDASRYECEGNGPPGVGQALQSKGPVIAVLSRRTAARAGAARRQKDALCMMTMDEAESTDVENIGFGLEQLGVHSIFIQSEDQDRGSYPKGALRIFTSGSTIENQP